MLKPVAVLCFMLAAGPLEAQVPTLPPPSAPPESVVTVFIADMKAGDWKGSTRLMDSAETEHLATVLRRLAAKPGVGAGLAQAWHISESDLGSMAPSDLLGAIMQVAAGGNAIAAELLKTATISILGRVDEGADQTHIVVRSRMTFKGIPVSTTEVRSLRRSAAGWRIELPAELTGMIAGIEATMSSAD